MTNQEILEKAVRQAIGGGWDVKPEDIRVNLEIDKHIDWKITDNTWMTIGYEALVYAHPFAKALWGDTQYGRLPKHGLRIAVSGAGMHLQQMVIAADPIKYLGENI